jgi:hypothetical protein
MRGTSQPQDIDLRAKFVARVLKKRDFILGYIRTHSNIADQFTKIDDPIYRIGDSGIGWLVG